MHGAVGRGEAFDRDDRSSFRLRRENRAGLDRTAVDVHGAGAALARVAADVRAGEAEFVRIRSTSSVRGSISALTGLPLTVRESVTGIVPPEVETPQPMRATEGWSS